MRPLLSALVVLLLVAADGRAQTTLREVRPDQLVRVETFDGGRTIGHFVAATADTLMVSSSRTRDRLAIPFESIRKVEVHAGYNRSAAVGVDTLVGLVGGLGLGVLCARVCDDGALAPVGGLFLGPPIGALLGALLAPSRWRDVFQTQTVRSRPE